MSRKLMVLSVLAVLALTFAVTTQAQTLVKQEITQATVVSVGENFLVVKLADGTIKGYDVPAGFMFDQAGAKVPLSALKPGQVITATINTTEPLIEHVEEVNAVTVVKVVDRHLTVQLADGTYHRYFVPKGYRFDVDGKSLSVFQLQPGMKLSTTIVSENEVGTMTEAEYKAEASNPGPHRHHHDKLPKTAGQLPLIGLLGLLSLGLGAGLSAMRRS
jgi:hypothetical protein